MKIFIIFNFFSLKSTKRNPDMDANHIHCDPKLACLTSWFSRATIKRWSCHLLKIYIPKINMQCLHIYVCMYIYIYCNVQQITYYVNFIYTQDDTASFIILFKSFHFLMRIKKTLTSSGKLIFRVLQQSSS